jgi:hypothetical protein
LILLMIHWYMNVFMNFCCFSNWLSGYFRSGLSNRCENS